MCPILEALLKMESQYHPSSRDNATPFSGKSTSRSITREYPQGRGGGLAVQQTVEHNFNCVQLKKIKTPPY